MCTVGSGRVQKAVNWGQTRQSEQRRKSSAHTRAGCRGKVRLRQCTAVWRQQWSEVWKGFESGMGMDRWGRVGCSQS